MQYVLSEYDRSYLAALMEKIRQTPVQAPPGQPSAEPRDGPETYVARAPDGGIPAFSSSNSSPGSADCDIWTLSAGLPTATTAAVPIIEQMQGLSETVYNQHPQAIEGGTWCLVSRDKFGTWWVADGGGTSSTVAVLIQGFINFQDAVCGSGDSGSGECGSGDSSGTQCRAVYHHARLQRKVCGVWCDAGCVWVEDVNGQKLETGRRYLATLIGVAPSGLEAVIIDPSSGLCSPSPVLYGVDCGNRTFTILVGERLGQLCHSGSGAGGTSQSLGGLSSSLIWSRGVAYGFSDVACGWVVITDLIIADPRGCGLTAGDVVDGHFNRMVSNAEINGAAGSGDTGDAGCTASYLAIRQPKTGSIVQCCPGGGIRIFTYTGSCDQVTAMDCGCTGGSGGAGSGMCGLEAAPLHYAIAVSGVTNNTCLTCNDWNATKTATWDGTCWTVSFTPSCPGLACVAWTLCCFAGNMVADICGATYTLPISSWNATGSNVMNYAGGGNPACNWPPTITVTAA